MKIIDKYKNDPLIWRRIWLMLAGQVIVGVSVGMFRFARFGVDPYNSFVLGTWHLLGERLGYGTYSMIICFILLVIDLIFMDRSKVGLGTIFNMFVQGYVVQFTDWALGVWKPDPSIGWRILFLIIGLAILCYASSMYYVADLGVSPYDCIPLSVSERVRPSFKWVRIAFDCICVEIGIIGNQLPGIGTIIIALCLGPFIEFFHPFNMKILHHGRN